MKLFAMIVSLYIDPKYAHDRIHIISHMIPLENDNKKKSDLFYKCILS